MKPPKKCSSSATSRGINRVRDVTSRHLPPRTLARPVMVTGSRSRSAAAQRIQSRKEAPIPTAACDPGWKIWKARGPQNVGRIRSLGPKISLRLGATPCHRVWVFRWGTFGGLKFKCQKFGGFRYSYILQEGGKVMNMCMFTNCETSFFESVSDIKIQQT